MRPPPVRDENVVSPGLGAWTPGRRHPPPGSWGHGHEIGQARSVTPGGGHARTAEGRSGVARLAADTHRQVHALAGVVAVLARPAGRDDLDGRVAAQDAGEGVQIHLLTGQPYRYDTWGLPGPQASHDTRTAASHRLLLIRPPQRPPQPQRPVRARRTWRPRRPGRRGGSPPPPTWR